MNLGQGVYRNMPMDQYQADPCVSPSLTRGIIRSLISTCPAKVWHENPRFNPDFVEAPNGVFDLGSSCHSLFLEGIDIAIPIDFPDWRTKAAKEERDTARQNGKIPLLLHQYQQVKRVVESAKEQLSVSELGIMDLQKEGESELTYIWKEKSGIWCRIRPDWVSNVRDIILDYKTTGMSAEPSDFARNIISTGIDIQGALYTRGVNKVEGFTPKFVLMVQELTEPFLCSFISLSPQFMEMGKSKMLEGMTRWDECLKSGDWYGYPPRLCYLDAPPWALAQWEERKFNGQLKAQEASTNGNLPF